MRRLLLPAAAAAATLLLAGCGASAPKGPPALVFVGTKDGDYAIFGADANGKHVRRLTKEKGDPSTPAGLFFQHDPAWSPDGRSIAFASLREGTSHIYVMNADGTGTRRVTDSTQDDEHPSWSPDGSSILFAREGALFVAPASGGAAHRVGKGPGNAADPAWSPDGKLIAYDYRTPGSPIREVYVMRADGTRVRRLTKLGSVSGLPAWAPDGKRLAFQSDAYGGQPEVYTVRADGSGLAKQTTSANGAIQPAWSPDGRLTFARDGAIWVDEGGTQVEITPEKANASSPAWRPVQPQ
jgi:TolB protein